LDEEGMRSLLFGQKELWKMERRYWDNFWGWEGRGRSLNGKNSFRPSEIGWEIKIGGRIFILEVDLAFSNLSEEQFDREKLKRIYFYQNIFLNNSPCSRP
jgi:hypothetical protein